MRSRTSRLVFTLMAVALLAASCSSSDDSGDAQPTTTTASATTTSTSKAPETSTSSAAPTTTEAPGTSAPGGVLELAISAEDNEAFNLDRLSGKAGQETTVTFKNKDTASGEPHNWHVVVEAGIEEYATLITAGPDTQSVSFTIGTAGEYSFYCDTHAEAMKGILIVEP